MKHLILFIALLFSVTLAGQDLTIDKGTGWLYFSGVPGTTPNTSYGAEVAINVLTREAYIWNRGSGAWIPWFTLGSLSGVDTSSVAVGKVIKWNGSAWVASDDLTSAGSGVSVSQIPYASDTSSVVGPMEGDLAINAAKDTLLIHNGSYWVVFTGSGSVIGNYILSDTTVTNADALSGVTTPRVLQYVNTTVVANLTAAAGATRYVQTPSGSSLSDVDLGKTLTVIAKDSSSTYDIIVSAGDANGLRIRSGRAQTYRLQDGQTAIFKFSKAVGASEYGYEWVLINEPATGFVNIADLKASSPPVTEAVRTLGYSGISDGGALKYTIVTDTTGLGLVNDSLNLVVLASGNFAISELDDCRRMVRQAAHGFTAGEAVYFDGSVYVSMDGIYGDTINPVGVVLKSFDSNTFLLGECGAWNSDFGLVDGLYYSTDAGLSIVPDTAQYPILRVSGNQSTINPIIPYSDEVDGINLFTITTPSGNNQIIGGESFVLSGDSTIHSGSLRGATLTTVEQALDSLETGRVGRIDIKGTSTSSSNAALKVANSTTTIFTAYENGVVSFLADSEATAVKSIIINANGSYDGAPNLTLFRDAVVFNQVGKIQYTATTGSTPTPYILIHDRSTLSATSGFQREVGIGSTFAPTSGTAVYTTLRITPTVNQTGGANGTTAGIRIAPTLTAAADWSSLIIENTSGKGIVQSSTTATNTLAGLTTMNTGIASIAGISATATAAKNIRGSLTISDANTTGTVTFGTAETDATYYVTATATGQTGTPAAGSTRVYITSKGTGGFTVNLEVAPGAGNSITVDWIMIR